MISAEKPVSRRPSLKINALSNIGVLAINVIVGLFLTPAMLNYLGEKRFGIWVLGSSLVGYFGLLDFGVGSAVFRYVPLFRGQGNHHRVSAVVSTSLVFYSVLSLTIILCTALLGGPLARYFGGGSELAGLLRVVGVATALGLPAIVLNTTTASYESFAPANLVAGSAQILRALLLCGCMLLGLGLLPMGGVLVVVSFVSLAGNFTVFRRACCDVHVRIKAVNWVDLKILLSFGSVMLLVGTANSLATESPKQIVAKTISLGVLGIFSIPLQLILYYRTLIISITKVFSPRFSFLAGSEADAEVQRLFVQGCRYMAMIAGCVAILLWVCGPSFMLLWTRKPEIAQAASALGIMVAGTFVFLSHRLGGDLLFGLGRQNQVAILELLEAAGIVGLTILCSLRFGIAGAALGFAIPPILIRSLLQTWFVCRALRLGFWEYYSSCVLPSWLVVGVLMAVAWLLRLRDHANGWLPLILVSALLLLAYVVSIYAFVLKPHEKQHFRDQLDPFSSRLKRLCATLSGVWS